MARRITSFFSAESGVAAVEMALVFPLFLVLVFGVIDVSRFFWTQHAVCHAVSEGVRMGMLSEPTDSEVISVITDALEAGGVDVTSSISISGRTVGANTSISVSMPFQYLFLPDWVAGAFNATTISSTAVMQYE